ncbi:hypothetical protein OBBRIDRAFT_737119 [Obba rivulosa]|uniref:Uncharacterized protein n=1 Tax=Obba rivulosa TaxID=1052685 RepID=A0A8E2AWW3_9APHY|nr:hypothetical protein OBBRIDRAFT_737119 [Obba rivulosa]
MALPDVNSSVVEMLSIFEEFQKRKATKTSSRSTEFQRKKNALFDQARMDAEDVVREGVVYVDQARARVAELKAHETSFEKSQRNLSFLAQRQNEAAGVAFDTYTSLLEELSRRRAGQVNEASATRKSLRPHTCIL